MKPFIEIILLEKIGVGTKGNGDSCNSISNLTEFKIFCSCFLGLSPLSGGSLFKQ